MTVNCNIVIQSNAYASYLIAPFKHADKLYSLVQVCSRNGSARSAVAFLIICTHLNGIACLKSDGVIL
ncbi:hypothetical protein SAMN05661096_00065 [Marivirga sericea]|uniref:Uncharacterized protein n=1 Tax=Marivirga sericea TaxID=1028 RepID=A0A1X7I017_9BACT|nr:hypothetical protein SAMN05661096_00065 [Marivirga sericea]